MLNGQMFNLILLIGVILFSIVAILSVMGAWKRTALGRKLFRTTKRSPLRDNLLRSPGQAIHDNLLNETLDLNSNIWSLVLITFFGVVLAPFSSRFIYFTIPVWIILSLFILLILLRIKYQYKKIQDMRLGLDGELATAEELNQLMHYGCYVFHDFPGDHFNIDHVVIGPAGVFTIETKTRSKPVGKGKQGATVFFKDSQLIFPNFQESKSIQQAKEQSKCLSDFIRKSVGKSVPVNAVLALPGWMVERQMNDGNIMVINPKEIIKYVTAKKIVLDEQTIQQIKYQVEQRCRTVEPYKP